MSSNKNFGDELREIARKAEKHRREFKHDLMMKSTEFLNNNDKFDQMVDFFVGDIKEQLRSKAATTTDRYLYYQLNTIESLREFAESIEGFNDRFSINDIYKRTAYELRVKLMAIGLDTDYDDYTTIRIFF